MSWKDAIFPAAAALLGWIIRHAILKYERALISAEKARREALESKLSEMKQVIAGLHTLVTTDAKNRENLKIFLARWALELKGSVADQFKLHSTEIEDLRSLLNTLVTFFNASKDSEKSSATQIGKDLFLIHRKETKS